MGVRARPRPADPGSPGDGRAQPGPGGTESLSAARQEAMPEPGCAAGGTAVRNLRRDFNSWCRAGPKERAAEPRSGRRAHVHTCARGAFRRARTSACLTACVCVHAHGCTRVFAHALVHVWERALVGELPGDAEGAQKRGAEGEGRSRRASLCHSAHGRGSPRSGWEKRG